MAKYDDDTDFGIRPARLQKRQAEEIARQTAAFLSKGGKITALPTGCPATEPKRITTWGYDHSVSKGGKASRKTRRKAQHAD